MKKILMIALIIGFVGAGNAFADFSISGRMDVDTIQVFKATNGGPGPADEQIVSCLVGFRFTIVDQFDDQAVQFFYLDAPAFGNALNLTIVGAYLAGVPLEARLKVDLQPELDLDILWVRLPAPDLPPAPFPGEI